MRIFQMKLSQHGAAVSRNGGFPPLASATPSGIVFST
jgi:hypothetical protein